MVAMVEDKKARDAWRAAAMDIDIDVEKVADVYAEAFLGAAENVKAAGSLLDAFDSVLADVLDPFPQFEEILASGMVSHEEKVGILDRVLGPRVPPMLLNFLKVVSRHGRLDCLRAIHRQTHLLLEKKHGRVRVELTTPIEIDELLAEKILTRLAGLVGGEPILQRRVDPSLIGGAVLRVGDTVYDGSIATLLLSMREQMINRSFHEIQSGRDRFRDPARD